MTSSRSTAILGLVAVPDADVDHLFAQAGIRHPEVDLNLNCGICLPPSRLSKAIRERASITSTRSASSMPVRNVKVVYEGELRINGGHPGQEPFVEHASIYRTARPIARGEVIPRTTAQLL